MSRTPDPLSYRQPYQPLCISGDDEGNARRQAEAAHINRTTNRTVDGREVVKQFAGLCRSEGLDPSCETTTCPQCNGAGYAGGAVACACSGTGVVLRSSISPPPPEAT